MHRALSAVESENVNDNAAMIDAPAHEKMKVELEQRPLVFIVVEARVEFGAQERDQERQPRNGP